MQVNAISSVVLSTFSPNKPMDIAADPVMDLAKGCEVVPSIRGTICPDCGGIIGQTCKHFTEADITEIDRQMRVSRPQSKALITPDRFTLSHQEKEDFNLSRSVWGIRRCVNQYKAQQLRL